MDEPRLYLSRQAVTRIKKLVSQEEGIRLESLIASQRIVIYSESLNDSAPSSERPKPSAPTSVAKRTR